MASSPHYFHWNFDTLCSRQNTALKYYMENVLRMQYLHADDGSLDSIIWTTIHSSESARQAVCLLSDLHRSKCARGNLSPPPPSDTSGLQRLQTVLPMNVALTEGDALAGLCVVSYFLFSGGKGQWQRFLDAVCRFSVALLNDPRGGGPRRMLRECTPSLRFIIKTSIWFDVLASATLVRTPIMLDVVHALFSQHASAGVDESLGGGWDEAYSMLPIMGCENHIVLSLANIAELAAWKDRRQRVGNLSVPSLVQRGQRIEKMLKKASMDEHGQGISWSVVSPGVGDEEEERMRQRRLTSEVFRASAHVYLHSVISGDFPQCPEIMEAVNNTVRCLRMAEGERGRAVVRSVVFSICISGCLTANEEHQGYFLERLREQKQEALGNCRQVEHLVKEVWKRRRGGEPVDWRGVMREAEMLLV